MPVPTLITDLSTTAATNSPAGTDAISNTMDDYIRSLSAFIAQNYANKASLSQLSASSGSSLIGFLQSGTGAVATDLQTRGRKFVLATDFSGVDPTGATDSTVGLQAAINAATYLRIPAGTYLTGALTWPSTLKGLIGDGWGSTIITANGTIAGFTPLIGLSSISNFSIQELQINVNKTTYPTVWCVQMLSCTFGRIERVQFPNSGSASIRGSGCSDIEIDKCTSVNWVDSGITFPNTTADNTRISITRCYVPGTGTQTSHNINVVGGGQNLIDKCVTTNNVVGSFGANMYLVVGGHIQGCIFSNGVAEGANAQDCTDVHIHDNVVVCSASHHDFGISLYGSNVAGAKVTSCSVSDNIIVSAGKAGVAFAGFVNNSKASNNLIINPNSWVAATDHANWGGVTFYGLGCNSNVAQGNYTYDANANVKYSVNEWNDGTGNPNFNQFIDNPYSASGLTAEIALVGANSLAWMTAWQNYTPTVTPAGGAVTSTINSASYRARGKTVEIQWDITIPTSTGTGNLTISLPPGFSAGTNGGVITGQEIVTNGWALAGRANGGGVPVVNYNNAFPGAATSRFVMSGLYKAA